MTSISSFNLLPATQPCAEHTLGVARAEALSAAAQVGHRYCAAESFATLGAGQGDGWLSDRERAEFAAWHDAGRRRVWLVGRMLGKQLVASTRQDDAPLATIELLSLNREGRGSRPRVFCHGAEQPWSFSLSHTSHGVLAALATAPGVSLGVDLAMPKLFSDGFIQLWFTPAEQQWIRESTDPNVACYVWAVKEALYKACNEGEGFAPRSIEVLADGRCSYRNRTLQGHGLRSWSVDGQIAVVATVISGTATTAPNP